MSPIHITIALPSIQQGIVRPNVCVYVHNIYIYTHPHMKRKFKIANTIGITPRFFIGLAGVFICILPITWWYNLFSKYLWFALSGYTIVLNSSIFYWYKFIIYQYICQPIYLSPGLSLSLHKHNFYFVSYFLSIYSYRVIVMSSYIFGFII